MERRAESFRSVHTAPASIPSTSLSSPSYFKIRSMLTLIFLPSPSVLPSFLPSFLPAFLWSPEWRERPRMYMHVPATCLQSLS